MCRLFVFRSPARCIAAIVSSDIFVFRYVWRLVASLLRSHGIPRYLGRGSTKILLPLN